MSSDFRQVTLSEVTQIFFKILTEHHRVMCPITSRAELQTLGVHIEHDRVTATAGELQRREIGPAPIIKQYSSLNSLRSTA